MTAWVLFRHVNESTTIVGVYASRVACIEAMSWTREQQRRNDYSALEMMEYEVQV